MTAVRILIVEDELIIAEDMAMKLEGMGYSVVGSALDYEEAIDLLASQSPDIALLDINLGEEQKDGIWLGEYIRFHNKIPFVYLTAYETSDIVDRALATEPHAYLTKPFNELSLRTSLAIAGQQHASSQATEPKPQHLLVKHNELLKQVLLEDITYMESDGNYLKVHTQQEQYRYRSTVSSILANLPQDQFLQTHRAFIVNRSYITGFSRTVVSIGGIEVPVSKSKAAVVTETLK